jgi:hypothetical protein
MQTTWETDAMRNCIDNHQMDLRETVCKWTGFVRFRTGLEWDVVNTAIRLQTFSKRGNLPDQLNLGSSTRGPPGYIMRPTATLVNYVYCIRITQLFRRLGTPLIVIFLHAASEPAHNNECGLWP